MSTLKRELRSQAKYNYDKNTINYQQLNWWEDLGRDLGGAVGLVPIFLNTYQPLPNNFQNEHNKSNVLWLLIVQLASDNVSVAAELKQYQQLQSISPRF